MTARTLDGLANSISDLRPRHAAGVALMSLSLLTIAWLNGSDPSPLDPLPADAGHAKAPEAAPTKPPAPPEPSLDIAERDSGDDGVRPLGAITPISAMLRLARLEPELPPRPVLPIKLAPQPPGETGATAKPAAAPEELDRKLEVRRGDTLMSLLTSAGIGRKQAYAAVEALGELFQPRDLKPGQALHLALAPGAGPQGEAETSPRLISIDFRPDPERDIRVTRGDGGFVAEAIARPLTRRMVREVAVVESSLTGAGQAAGIPTAVLFEAIRAFSFDVDFQRALRRDDTLELLYEDLVDDAGRHVKSGALRYAALTLSGKRRALYRFTPNSGFTDYFDEDGHSIRRTLIRTPIDGARLSSGFGMRKHPILGYSRMHRGIDFAAPRGTPIFAAGNGKIERLGRNGGYGNYIRIRHNGTYKTAYAHLKAFAKGLKQGSRVEQGQVIGYVGTTGRSTGPHLHYEVLARGKQVNPLKLDLPSGERLAGADLEAFRAVMAEVDALRRRPLAETLVAEAACDGGLPLAQGDAESAAGPGDTAGC